jgi:Fe-S oxidoreductase
MSRKAKQFVPQGLNFIADNIKTKQNIIGAPKDEKAKWARDLDFSNNMDTIFFAGCGYQFSASLESMITLMRKTDKSLIGSDFAMSIASFQKKMGINAAEIYRKISTKESKSEAKPLRDAVKVLKYFGLEFGYLAEEEPCCGGSLHFAGLQSDFRQNALKAYNKLKSFGVKQIISIVPSCTYSLRDLFPVSIQNYEIEVRHFSQVVLENIKSKKLRLPEKTRVTYHDPCQLGRYLGLIDEPRKIFKAIDGVELVEPDWKIGRAHV